MVECDYCGKGFNNEKNLHLHWGRSHEEQLSSHDKEKVKKAKRDKQNKKQAERQKKKRNIKLYSGVAAVIIFAAFSLWSLTSMDGSNNRSVDLIHPDNQPVKGSPSANISIVEFGDYKCPYCARWQSQIYPKIKRDYIETGKARMYFINYAFLGPTSDTAAQAGECVYNQDWGEFWKFHEYVYSHQGSERDQWADKDTMLSYAKESTKGLNYQKLEQCIVSGKEKDTVAHDKRLGKQAGLKGTPQVYVDGEKVSDSLDYQQIKAMIERKLE